MVHHREDVLGVAAEAIELPDGEHIAFAEMVEASFQLRAASRRAADAVVGEDAALHANAVNFRISE